MLLTIQVPDVRRCNDQFAFCNRRFVDVIANSNVIASSPMSVRIRRCNRHRQVTTYKLRVECHCQKLNLTGKKFQIQMSKSGNGNLLQMNFIQIGFLS